jgi:hypothetical protein
MITEDDEKQLREKIRRSLEQFKESEPSALKGDAVPEVKEPPENSQRKEQIITEETERYFQEKGLVKHISSTGRVYWLTPEEKERRISLRSRKKRTKRTKQPKRKITRKEVLFYIFFFLGALIIILVLFHTAVFNL